MIFDQKPAIRNQSYGGRCTLDAALEIFGAAPTFGYQRLKALILIQEIIMANVVRYSPFEDAFDDLFRGFMVRPFDVERALPSAQVKMDVSENDNAYIVKADLPGVKKEEINVSINANQVAISAEVKREKEAKNGEKELRGERHYGKVYRAFTLAQDVDEASAQARYHDGVLELTLPKKAATQTKKLTIQ